MEGIHSWIIKVGSDVILSVNHNYYLWPLSIIYMLVSLQCFNLKLKKKDLSPLMPMKYKNIVK